jgi:hypothetical protein
MASTTLEGLSATHESLTGERLRRMRRGLGFFSTEGPELARKLLLLMPPANSYDVYADTNGSALEEETASLAKNRLAEEQTIEAAMQQSHHAA